MRIVIVEDEIRIREGIGKLLRNLGNDYEVVGEAGDGEEGVALCLDTKPDLVITDIRMPKMDGIEMLSKLAESNLKNKAIVISAYSEFEYARGAMKLGVTEYLLKPISVMDFSAALENIKAQILEESAKTPANIGTLEQTVTDLYYGSIILDDEIKKYLSKNYGIDPTQKVWIACAYLGKLYEESDKYKKMLQKVFAENMDAKFVVIESPFRHSLLFIFYQYKSAPAMEHWLQYRMLQSDMVSLVFGCVEAEDMSTMKSAYDHLAQYMDWNISFEKEILISYPKIMQIQTAICSYPMDVESQLKSILCTSNKEKAMQLVAGFHASFLDGKIYEPREIKDCYVRFLWHAMEIAQDLGNVDAGCIDRQDLLKRIMEANSKAELISLSNELMDLICKEQSTDENVADLTVKRAKSLIHEFYNTGITLDEMAAKLGITPEYLGTKFRNETGVTFSTYMREYRIGKAKELLLGTNLKLYEIAERVGYNDPKYLSRVFKEVTGKLPADFRKDK